MIHIRFFLLPCAAVLLTFLATVQVSAQLSSEMLETIRPGVNKPPLLEKMLAGPMKDVEHIVFAIRIIGRDHWYVNFGHYSGLHPSTRTLVWKEEDGLLWGYGEGAALIKQNIRTGEIEILLHDERGGIRDPQLHYDGHKILMSYRPGGTHVFHLYEMDIDGTNLRQLTDGIYDDIEPAYCPDGTIIFCSSRCKRFINCWHTPTTSLFRCDADGQNIRMVSSNSEHDNTPWTLPDGRVLYTRWEYVDRSRVDFHHLWTMNPDGTQQVAYFGNLHPGTVMIDAKPIPGTDKVISIFSPGHGNTEHMGHLVVVSPKKGPDDLGSAQQLGTLQFKDPYAFSEDCFLAADNHNIFIVDGEGNPQPLFTLPKELQDQHFSVHEPRPVGPRPREAVIADRTNLSQSTGYIIMQDAHLGRVFHGLAPGTIKKLLVLRLLPKPVNFSGGMEPLTIGGSFTLAEILGTIPVADDGSAFAELPALQSIILVALDENDLSVKRMHSFLTLQPGETMACIGCHEERIEAPNMRSPVLQATRRAPAIPQPILGVPSIIDFPRDVQPILDKHCVSCHSPENYGGRLDLTGDMTSKQSMSYTRLTLHGQWVVDNRDRPRGNLDPYEVGSGASTLLEYLEPEHYGVNLSTEEKNLVRLWIDTSATYPGTYASLRGNKYFPNINRDMMVERCGECHLVRETREGVRGTVEVWRFPNHHLDWNGQAPSTFNFERLNWLGTTANISNPQRSFLLRAPLAKEAGGLGLCSKVVFENKNDPLYQNILQSIEQTHQELLVEKRFDMPGFRPNSDYIREMQKYGFVKKDLAPDELFDYYGAEREYYDSFYFDPALRDIRAAGIP